MGEHEDEAEEPGRLASRWPLSTMAVEVFSIVLGVLLALGVNEWRQHQADRQLADRARANIFAELEANRNHLRFVHSRNLVFQKQIAGEAAENEEELIYQPAWGLQDTAWNVARDTGALHHMSFGAVNGFSSVYGFQQTYRVQVLQLTQAQMMGLLSLSSEAEAADPGASSQEIGRRSGPVVELLIENEKALLEAYDSALAYRD